MILTNILMILWIIYIIIVIKHEHELNKITKEYVKKLVKKIEENN